MERALPESTLYVVFTAAGQRFAVRHEAVVEMVQPPPVVPLPGAGPAVLGLVNLRGKVLGMVDFRLAMGQHSAGQELDSILADLHTYEQSHHAWLDELERAIRDRVPFSGQRDPRQCAFGHWLDTFQSSNVVLHQHIQSFHEPHRRVHALADRLLRHEDREEALQILEQERSIVLPQLEQLFLQTRTALLETRREIAIVVPGEGGHVAVLVDSVDSIEALQLEDGEGELGSTVAHTLLGGVATDAKDELVLLVDDSALVHVFGRSAA